MDFPLAFKQHVYLLHIGKKYEHKCFINYCDNIINCFNFEIIQNKKGLIEDKKLLPVCNKCYKKNKY